MSEDCKIKIVDDINLRRELIELYRLTDHTPLITWSLTLAKRILLKADIEEEASTILSNALNVAVLWQNDQVSMQELRQASFKVHKHAREAETDIQTAALRTAAHAIASAHMKEHALVASDYAIKTIGLISQNNPETIHLEREWQVLN